jgi:hypothetical protein
MRLLCVLCVLCGSGVSLSALDRHAFTFTHYDLNARIEPDQQRLAVRGEITLRNDSDTPQKEAALQISSSLNWLSIRFEGKPAQFVAQSYTSDIDHTGALSEAIVVLPRLVAPKQSVELEIGYEGVIAQDATRETRIGVPADIAKHSDWDQISKTFTAVRGIGYVAWYPISTGAVSLSEGNRVFEEVGRWEQSEAGAEMKVDFSVSGASPVGPPELLCTGEKPEQGLEEMGQAYSLDARCAFLLPRSAVAVFVIGRYEFVSKSSIELFSSLPHKSGADDYALAVEQVAPLISKWFGDHRDTPMTKAEVVDLPDPEDAPFASGTMLIMPLATDETTMLLSAVRQMTRLYFPSPRAWITDGLAAYAQANYFLNEKGRAAAIAYLQSHRGVLLQSEKENLAQGDRSAATSLINATDELYVQAKAMNVWWMLRDVVGDAALTAALHQYNALDDVRADYLQKLVEGQAHRDLEWFFDDWVYRDAGLPNLDIVSVYPRELVQGGYIVTVEVENKGASGVEVPVTAHMSEGEATEKVIVPGKAKASVRVVTPALPREITANDGSVPESETTTHVYKIEAK